MNRSRKPAGRQDGGQFARSAAPAQIKSAHLSLLESAPTITYKPNQKTKVACLGLNQNISTDQNGEWINPSLFTSSVFRAFRMNADGNKDEVLDSAVQVSVDMFNEGDAVHNDAEHLKAISWGTLVTGRALGGENGWVANVRMPQKTMNNQAVMAMAQLRSAAYFIEDAERKRTPAQLASVSQTALEDHATKVPKRIRADALISTAQIFNKHFYKGTDGKLIHRYVEIPLGSKGNTFLNPNKTGHWANHGLGRSADEKGDKLWVAAYLLGTTKPSSKLYGKAVKFFREGGYDSVQIVRQLGEYLKMAQDDPNVPLDRGLVEATLVAIKDRGSYTVNSSGAQGGSIDLAEEASYILDN